MLVFAQCPKHSNLVVYIRQSCLITVAEHQQCNIPSFILPPCCVHRFKRMSGQRVAFYGQFRILNVRHSSFPFLVLYLICLHLSVSCLLVCVLTQRFPQLSCLTRGAEETFRSSKTGLSFTEVVRVPTVSNCK
jgi:hypothetical protein